MCRVLNFRFLQPLPIWHLLERPWWSALPLHFLFAIPSKHHPSFLLAWGIVWNSRSYLCVSLPSKLNIHFTARSVRYPVRSVYHFQVHLLHRNHWTDFCAGAESSGSCEQCLPGDYSIAEGDRGRQIFLVVVRRAFSRSKWRGSRSQLIPQEN